MAKILLVDDEERLLKNMALFFEDEDHDVVTALSGEEAMEKLAAENFDACVVDMRLPGIDGNEVIRRAMAAGLLSRFLIHTGSTDYKIPADLLELGVSDKHVFLKPLEEMEILAAAVESLIGGEL